MSPKDKDVYYTDFSNVETQRTFLTSEEFPDGAFGSPVAETKPVENKSTPWKHGQQYYTYSNYENRNLHQNLPRQFPGAHPTHDESSKDTEEPYNDIPPN